MPPQVFVRPLRVSAANPTGLGAAQTLPCNPVSMAAGAETDGSTQAFLGPSAPTNNGLGHQRRRTFSSFSLDNKCLFPPVWIKISNSFTHKGVLHKSGTNF